MDQPAVSKLKATHHYRCDAKKTLLSKNDHYLVLIHKKQSICALRYFGNAEHKEYNG
jgi:hypothetical protein